VQHLTAKGILSNRDPLLKALRGDVPDDYEHAQEFAQGVAPMPGPLYAVALARFAWSPVAAHVFVNRPNILTRHSYFEPTASGFALRQATDIVSNDVGVTLAGYDPFRVRLLQGVFDTNVEARIESSQPDATNPAWAFDGGGNWIGVKSPQDPQLSAQRAAEYVAQGFTAIKFDPAGPYSAFDGRQLSLAALDLCERFMRELRAAVGSSADLLFGTHGQMTAAGAIRLARRLEPYDPLWFEEPVPPDAPEEMARVARATSIPIAAGERLATKYDFARVLRAGAAAILQMNLGRVGGLLEAKKIAALAEVQHVQLAPHLYCGPVVGAANIQLATCSPNFLILEGIERWQGFHADLLVKPIRWEAGYVIPPSEPGLGVELNEAVMARHPYQGTQLHLESAGSPIG